MRAMMVSPYGADITFVIEFMMNCWAHCTKVAVTYGRRERNEKRRGLVDAMEPLFSRSRANADVWGAQPFETVEIPALAIAVRA